VTIAIVKPFTSRTFGEKLAAMFTAKAAGPPPRARSAVRLKARDRYASTKVRLHNLPHVVVGARGIPDALGVHDADRTLPAQVEAARLVRPCLAFEP